MTIHLKDAADRIWSPMIVVIAGILFAIPAMALIGFGIATLAG